LSAVGIGTGALLFLGQEAQVPALSVSAELGSAFQDTQTDNPATDMNNGGADGQTVTLAGSNVQEGYSVAPKGSLNAAYDLQPQNVASSMFFFIGTITDVKLVQEFNSSALGTSMFSEGFITVYVEHIYQGDLHKAGESVVLYCAKANETDAQLGSMVAVGQSDVFFTFATDETTRSRWIENNPHYAEDFSRCTLALESTTGSVFPIRDGLICAPKGTDATFVPSRVMSAEEETAFTKGLRADGGSFVNRTYYTIEDFADIAAFSAATLKTRADEYLAAQG
jgi:hypothetical protein